MSEIRECAKPLYAGRNPQYWRKLHDVEGGATDAGQPKGTTPELF